MSHFRFLDLPRELRDVIYNYLILPTKEIYTGVDERDTIVTATDVPIPDLLQVSKEFNSEYSDQLPQSRTLHVRSGHCFWWTEYPGIPGPLAHKIKECYVYIHIVCYCDNMSDGEREEFEALETQCEAVDFLRDYRERLEMFLSQLRNRQSLHLRIGLWGDEEATVDQDSEVGEESDDVPRIPSHSTGFADVLSMFIAPPLEVSDIEVVRCVSDEEYEGYRMGEKHGLPTYLTWSRTGGWRKGTLVGLRDG
ncbi:hypothetical protein PRZ48_015159 [Zasmidium cellare]|uniref:F-box protein n=1 Tax=Zasmidium cellare TaxID=395010 RepID=A0ABR0DYB1_ZASCE|nr:hypothetical protein PRZ48_015159 [Zasmidium cellare]